MGTLFLKITCCIFTNKKLPVDFLLFLCYYAVNNNKCSEGVQ